MDALAPAGVRSIPLSYLAPILALYASLPQPGQKVDLPTPTQRFEGLQQTGQAPDPGAQNTTVNIDQPALPPAPVIQIPPITLPEPPPLVPPSLPNPPVLEPFPVPQPPSTPPPHLIQGVPWGGGMNGVPGLGGTGGGYQAFPGWQPGQPVGQAPIGRTPWGSPIFPGMTPGQTGGGW